PSRTRAPRCLVRPLELGCCSARGTYSDGEEAVMTHDPDEVADLLRRAVGDQAALAALFDGQRERLRRLVRLRLSRGWRGGADEEDTLQEASREAARRLAEYQRAPILPFFLWLRHLTGLKLVEAHRRHLGTQARDAEREVSLHAGAPQADSASLAARL